MSNPATPAQPANAASVTASPIPKQRSPNYPAVDLQEAITRLAMIYEKQRRYPTTREVLVKLMGYTSLNGASATVVSALAKYGLIEGQGDQWRVSEMGQNLVLHRKGDPEYAEALRTAALSPAFFRELHDQYPTGLPHEHALRVTLAKRGFTSKAIDASVRAYRDTMEFVEAETGEPVAKPNGQVVEQETPGLDAFFGRSMDPPRQSAVASLAVTQWGADKVLAFNIAEDAEARIEFRGRVTQEAITKLIKMLELQQDTFPLRESILTSSSRRSLPEVDEHDDEPVA